MSEREGCRYKGKEDFNMFRKLLKELPPGKLEIIADHEEDQKVADQMNKLLRHHHFENNQYNVDADHIGSERDS